MLEYKQETYDYRRGDNYALCNRIKESNYDILDEMEELNLMIETFNELIFQAVGETVPRTRRSWNDAQFGLTEK